MEYTIDKLTEMKIEDYFKNKGDGQKYIITRFELLEFCIKFAKLLKREL